MKNRRLLRYMLAVYIASAVLISYQPWGANISQGIGIALAFLFVIEFLIERRRVLLPRELVLFSIFFAYTLVGGFVARDSGTFWTSEFTLFQLLMLSIISYNILTNCLPIILVMKAFVISAAIAGVLAIIGINTSSSSRLASTLGNPNMYGLVLLFSIGIGTYLFIQSSRKWARLFYLLLVPFFAYQIILTGSRKAIIGILAFAVIFFALYAARRFWYRPGRVFIYALILGGLLLGATYLAQHSPYYKRLEYFNRVLASREISLGGGSINERANFYRAAYATWRDHPLFGVGTNQFLFYAGDYVYGLRSGYAHSNFMEILADFGLIGFILYYLVYALIFLGFYRLRKLKLSDKDRLSMYALLTLMIVFVVSELAWVTYSEKITWIVLSIVIAQIWNMRRKYQGRESHGT